MEKTSTDKWIRNGRIVTATDDFQGDILTSDGKIFAVGKDLSALTKSQNFEVIDADGLLVFPGAIDVHTHLDLPFMGTSSSDDFETGTLAAISGGTTALIDFAMQTPGHSLREALNQWHEK